MEKLGEIRSLLPPSVRIMALTATATNTVRCSVTRTLGMDKPVVVALSRKPGVQRWKVHYSGRNLQTFVNTYKE